jgi:predicted Fe-S protein YdhL (DUF1289 family)
MDSPCIRACSLTPDGSQCTGCTRSIEEITHWGFYTDEERQDIISRCLSNVWGTKCRDCMSSIRAHQKNQLESELNEIPESPF